MLPNGLNDANEDDANGTFPRTGVDDDNNL
jgi:hypothetical protein